AKSDKIADRRTGYFRAEDNGELGGSFKGGFERGELFRCAPGHLPFTSGQPANRGGFLALRDLHKLRGFPLELDFIRIDEEEFRIEVADAGANLPGHQRILLRRIVADDQYRF